MKSVGLNKCLFMLFFVLCVTLLSFDYAWGADANLNIVFTTTDAGGSYGTRHVHVVWIKDASGNFVYTTGSSTTDNKRALWANARAYALKEWYNSNPTANRTADIAARTGATQTAYKTYNFNWNWRKKDGSTVPDGNYQIHFLCTNSDSGTPNNKTSFTITKGTSAWSVGPVSQGGYNNISLTFTPATLGVEATAATNIMSTSATLNGEVTATDGVNPNVYIYWGTTDGGTTPGNWDNEVSLGTHGVGPFSTDVTDLIPLTTYYYRCRVVTTSPAKDIWSDAVINFTTPTPETPKINVTPSPLDFGEVAVGEYKDLTVTIENLGKLALQINSLEFTGLDNDVYSLVSPPSLPIVLDASLGGIVDEETITIRFSPKSIQEYKYAQLAIGNDDPDKVASADLQGIGGPNVLLGTRPVGGIGGPAKTLAKYNDKILLGQGAMLVLLDISNPASPFKLNQIRLEGVIEAITVQDDVAYAALGNKGFAVINLKDFMPISGTTTFETGGFASDIDSEGTTLCIADGIAGTHVYDISMPLEPVFIKTYTTTGSVSAVSISDSLLYIFDHSEGVRVVQLDTTDSAKESIAHWEMDETSGLIATDSSSYNYNGTLMNMDDNDWIPGKNGYALDFDGIDDYVQIAGYKGITNSANRTCCAWIKTSQVSGDIMAWGDNLNVGEKWIIRVNETGALRAEVQGGYIYGTTPLNDGAWHHIAVVLNNDGTPDISEVQLYVDGHLDDIDGVLAQPINTADTQDVSIGVYALVKIRYFQGQIDDVRIYDEALTANEIQSIYSEKRYSGIEFGVSAVVDSAAIYATDIFGNLFVLDSAGDIALQSETMLQVGPTKDIKLQNGFAYVTGEAGLEILDVSNPTNPVSISTYSTLTEPSDILLDGTIAYVANGSAGLEVLNIANPAAVASIGNYALVSAPSAVSSPISLENVYTVGNEQYLTDHNLATSSAPVSYDILDQAEDIAVKDQSAFIAAGSSGLKIFDLSNSTATPASFSTDGFAISVSVKGSTAMVSDGNKVYVLDVSSPMTPALVGSWNTDGHAFDVAVGNFYGYVAEGNMGITILDLSNAQPVGFYPIMGVAYSVVADVNILYVASGSAGLTVLNISDPVNPELITEYSLPGVMMDVIKVENKLCLADAFFGISIVDVSNPAAPVLYASEKTSAPAFHISSIDSRILIADRKGGLAILGVTSWPKNTIGEITGDNLVDVQDLVLLANQWLGAESNLDVLNANLNYYDTAVNIADFAVLSEFWLTDYTPPVVNLEITNINPTSYVVSYDNLGVGENVYTDRTYTYSSIPSAYQNKTFIQTKNDDKQSTGDSFLTFTINKDCAIYVAHDDEVSPKPTWLSTFTDTGDDLTATNAPGVYSLYRKDFPAGTVTLGGNRVNESPSISMYMVVIVDY